MTIADGVDQRLTEVTLIVQSLVETMRANGLTKVEVEVGDVSIRLRAGAGPRVSVDEPAVVDANEPKFKPAIELEASYILSAPMIGTFYTSAAPAEPPLVRPGDHVEAGQAIGIIEAMKIMNEIASDRSGTVIEVLAGNAQPVEYGSPLLRLLLDEAEA
jgi:acetyl-CoA carboxylase biotin carboxyl carrier protein